LQEISSKHPSASFLTTLPENLKNDVLAQGLRENENLVGEQTHGFLKRLGDQVNPETYV